MEKFMICLVLGLLLCVNVAECKKNHKHKHFQYSATNCRKHNASLTDFGGVGDGKTLNTNAFKTAIANLSKYASDGGALLIVPRGRWLTGSFNLTSHFTLYIQKGAVLLASQNVSDYPIIKPLPSYGIGRDGGNRYASLIFGNNLTDVVITGGNGTIDGQGKSWWAKFKNKELNNTRPYLIEIMSSEWVQISNLTLIDSPSWNVHPIYCNIVLIENLTIIAPVNSPNTDGINPDSCTNTRIRDSYVVSGDDCIAVKSGWDEYGIRYGKPTENLSITRFTCISPDSAVIALGSEMSGGIQNVRATHIRANVSESGVRIKTTRGRGAYVKDIYVRGMELHTMKYVVWMTGAYGSNADKGYDPKALTNVTNINFSDVFATNVTMVGNLLGIKEKPFTGICISNVNATMAANSEVSWNCSDISGTWNGVKPTPCRLLTKTPKTPKDCAFPDDTLAIDKIELKTCCV